MVEISKLDLHMHRCYQTQPPPSARTKLWFPGRRGKEGGGGRMNKQSCFRWGEPGWPEGKAPAQPRSPINI